MTQSLRGHLARLCELLNDLEREAGLSELSEVERLIVYAMERLRATTGERIIRSDQLRAHPLLSGVTHPTFYRALGTLRNRQLIEIAPDARRGAYVFIDQV